MDEDWPFRASLIGLYSAYTLIRLVYHREMARDDSHDVVREPAAYEWGLRALVVYEVATLMTYLFAPHWWTWAALPLPAALRWVGVPLGLAALALLWWTHRSLGINFRPTLRVTERQELVTGGPYRMLRHPMYSALTLLHLGAALLLANAFLGATWLGGLALLLAVRIPREEAMLLARFGAPYRDHMARTGRLLPRWGGGQADARSAATRLGAARSLNTRAEGTGAGETRSRAGS